MHLGAVMDGKRALIISRILGGGVAVVALVAALALAAAGHAPGKASFAATPSTGWKLESGAVTLPGTSSGSTTFVSVPFRQTYDAPPLVFVIASEQGSQPSTVRIRNVTTAGFQVVQVEPPGMDGPHIAMTVHYLAVDPGVHVLPDGTSVEAGSVATTTVQHGAGVAGAEGWDTLNFGASFGTTPALLAQIQDMANETGSPPGAPSIPWLTTAVRNVTTTGAELAIERSEVDDGAVASPETIGYLAIEGGSLGGFLDNGGVSVAYEAIVSGAVLDGWSDGCDTVAFAASYSAARLVMATKSTHNDDDGGWLRRCSLSASSVGLTVDEDQDGDTERNHTTEAASIVVFSQEFDAEFEHDLVVTKTVDNATPNEGDTINYTVTLTNNGPTDGTGVEITDVLPSGLTYVSDTATQGSYDSATGVWVVGSLADGVNATLAITATVDGGTGGTVITNTAQITAADQFDPDSTNDSDSVDITVTNSDLTLSKTVDNVTPNEGDTVSYTITITNFGPDDATGIKVMDLLPAGVTYVSDDGAGAYVLSTGVWDVGALSSAAGDTLTISAAVGAGTGGTVITNTAQITAADQSDPDSTNNSASADTNVNSPPDAVDDAAATNEGTSVVIDVVANDTDAEGGLDAASVSIVAGPANGVLIVNPVTGELTYTPAPDFVGADSCTYQVCDDGGLCDSATVTITVNSVAEPPTPTPVPTPTLPPGPTPSPPPGPAPSPPATPTSASTPTPTSASTPTPTPTSAPDGAVAQEPPPAGDAGAPGLALPPADGTDLGQGEPSGGEAVYAFYDPPGPGHYPTVRAPIRGGTLWWQTVWGLALIASATFLTGVAVRGLAADLPSMAALRRAINRIRNR